MILYCIRDRLIGWWIQPPFFANSDQHALANIAELINGDSKHAIVQAPQHFEIWRIGEISEKTGDFNVDKEYLADASALLRGSVRETPIGRGTTTPGAAQRSTTAPGGTSGTT